MNNQHAAITGYRDLTQNEINLINEIKLYLGAGKVLADKVTAHINAQFEATHVYLPVEEEERLIALLPEEQRDAPTGLVQTAEAKDEWQRLVRTEPHRWVSIAKTDLQTAGMALARAVAQPTNF